MSWNGQIQNAPGFSVQKQQLSQALTQQGVSSPSARAQVLAVAEVEGTLQANNQDTSKNSGSANNSPFNLNTGMITNLNMQSLIPTLNDNSNPLAQDGAAVKVIEAAISTYGLQGFEEWQRGGQDLHDNFSSSAVQSKYDWQDYQAGYNYVESNIEASPSAFTDDTRFNPNISYTAG